MKDLELMMRTIDLLKAKGNLVDTITQLLEEGAIIADIKKALLYITTNYKAKEINDCCKTFAPVSAPRVNNKTEYNDFLVEGERTELDAYEYIIAQGIRYDSVNIIANMTHFLNLWSLADRIRGNSGEITMKAVNRKLASALMLAGNQQSEEVKEAWRILNEELAKPISKRSRSKVAEDKVKQFGDEELTKAYSEAQKDLNAYYDAKKKAKRGKKSA